MFTINMIDVVALEQHQDRLREAEARRLARQLKNGDLSWVRETAAVLRALFQAGKARLHPALPATSKSQKTAVQ